MYFFISPSECLNGILSLHYQIKMQSAMNKIKFILVALCSLFLSVAAQAAPKSVVQHVHPAFWWAGMEEPQLQILLYGTQIGSSTVSLSTPEIPLVRVEKPSNPNYLILYVNLKDAAPQQFDILLKQGRKTLKVPYEIKAREQRKRQTFDASDVVYLFMPDRFANGNKANDTVKVMRETGCDAQVPDARHGGDIAGVVDHLDYLADLGVTALWSTPMLENDMPSFSYHGYGITDYYRIDPRYGSNAEYKDMVTRAHNYIITIFKALVQYA